MKALSLSVAALAALFLVACGPSEAEIAANKEKATADSLAALAAMEMSYAVDAANSSVKWTGTMLGVKSHFGTIGLKEGKMSLKGGQITAGGFVADLNTIAPLDTIYAPDGSKQGTKSMLVGHLQSPDFFDVATYPTASFDITRVEGNTAYGNLTVRGKTNEEKVTDIVVTEENGMAKATGKLTFDRQKYGVAWSTGAKDMILNDNIELEITLTGNAQ
ncbi:MAG: YceI family protein [Flavobacteriales bacterium]|jgi:polyisoprenoid-binding protein YceI|nr:YceI family protein [Flavobacteriales bacterium]MBK9513015.1 YceI family protein [Flavobacteriales bacterium]MBP7450104.1 YceI family protein [Flavobacteriales bacterium]HOY29457.1 YceI family protein [Flavobacteriales bacterium]